VFNPYPEPQLKGYVLSHNSRNIQQADLQGITKALQIMHTQSKQTSASALSPCAAPEPPGETHF